MLKRENVVVAHCRVFIEHDFPSTILHAMPLLLPEKHIADEHDHDE